MMSICATLVLPLQIHIQEPGLTTHRYERKFPSSDLHNIEILKYSAESIIRSTTARLDKILNRSTAKIIQNKVLKFISV